MEIRIQLTDEEYNRGLRHHNISNYENVVKIMKEAFLRGVIACDTPVGKLEAWIFPSSDFDFSAPSAGVVLLANAGDGETVDLVNVNVNGAEGNIEQYMFSDPWTEGYTNKSIIKADEWNKVFANTKEDDSV